MTKLPNAPLQEVSAQLTWHLEEQDFNKYGFFAGDYFNKISNKYSNREQLVLSGLPLLLFENKPTHKFTYSTNRDFPFIAIGPGIAALNIGNEIYNWEDYSTEIAFAFQPIFEITPSFSDFKHIHLTLEYINFFEIDFEEVAIFEFLNKYLHTNIYQEFMTGIKGNNIDLNFSYADSDIGNLKFSYHKGRAKGKSEGLIVRTSALSGVHRSSYEQTMKWFDKAHEKCSFIFKEMTKGKLYESFK